MGCFSGCLMSSASIQKLFCGICSAHKCSFDEFVGEKVVSPSYSSAILGTPLVLSLLYGPPLTSIHDYWRNHSFDYTDICQQSDSIIHTYIFFFIFFSVMVYHRILCIVPCAIEEHLIFYLDVILIQII